MNETLPLLIDALSKKKTWLLISKIEKQLEGQKQGTVVAALLHILVATHVYTNVEMDGFLDTKQTNASFTELLQSMRRMHENLLACHEDDDDTKLT